MIYKFIVLLLFTATYTSCSDENSPEVNPESQITLYKNTLAQGEVGLLLTDEVFTSITATINNEDITLTKAIGGYGFIVPITLAKGEYSINIAANETTLELSLSVTEVADIQDPDQYVNNEIEKINTQISNSVLAKSKLPTNEQAAYQQDVDTIQSWIQQYKAAYELLSPEEKLAAAKTLEANRQNFEELVAAVDNLNAATLKLKKAEVENHEALIEDAMAEYTLAVIKVARSTAVAGILASTGFLTFGPIGAAIGGGIGIGLVALKFKELNAAQSVLLNNTFLPFQNMVAKFKKSTIEFEKGAYNELFIEASYRSVNNNDANGNSVPIANTFISSITQAKQIWDDLMAKLNVNLSFGAKDISEIATSKTEVRTIHSENLKIENISVNTITSAVDRSEGKFKLKFTNSEEKDAEFTFDIVYSNAKFGSLRETVSAKYIEGEPEPLTGQWITQALSDAGAEDTSDYYNYALIMNFSGMDCKCLSIKEKNLTTNAIFTTTSGYCIQKDSTIANKYYITEPDAECPPNDKPDGALTLLSHSKSELKISIVSDSETGPFTQNFTLTPY